MRHKYEYQKTHKRHPKKVFRRRLILAVLSLAMVGAGVYYLANDLQREKPVVATSKVVKSEVSESTETFKSPYFQFSDRGNWIYSQRDSTDKEFVYYKYRGAMIEHRLTVHVNEVPISLHLASTRVLPVKIVNNNRMEADSVAGPCSQVYKQGDPHIIKDVMIQGATMQCDPDSPLFTVVFAEVNGNYKLNFRQSNGLPIQLVITYQDMRQGADAMTVRQIAKSFQVL